MTVGTTNIALRDLEEDSTPRFVHREDDDVVLLNAGVAMIEVQNDDVPLAAVDARMGAEVFAYQRAVLLAVAANSRYFLSDVRVAVSQVMLASVFRVTCATSRLPGTSRFVRECERVDRLDESAVIATPCLDCIEQNRHEGPLRSGSALRSA